MSITPTFAALWPRLRRDRGALIGLGAVAALVVVAVAAPLVLDLAGAPGPAEQDSGAVDPVFGAATGPSAEHLLGVDDLGRDVFARVVYGTRVSLEVALFATALATILGVVAGVIAGYYRGWADALISRAIDAALAFPLLLLALGLGSACAGRGGCLGGRLEPGLWLVILTIACFSWTGMARIVRGQVLSLREREFVEAARALGAGDRHIIVREILPNLAATIIVSATVAIPTVIMFEAALSFLGVGVQPPDTSWGQMLDAATSSFDTAWWAMVFPGLALLLTVLAFTLVGEGLQRALGTGTHPTSHLGATTALRPGRPRSDLHREDIR